MIDKKTIQHISNLSRLYISDEEAQEFSKQLANALQYFDEISQVNTDHVEPMITPSEIESTWREDASKHEFTAEQMVENAPDKVGNLFKVPPVV